MTEDFSYLLMFELIKYIDSKNKSNISSFYEFLEKRIELIIENNKDFDYDNEIKTEGEKESEIIIKNSVEKISKIIETNIETDSNFLMGINLKKRVF